MSETLLTSLEGKNFGDFLRGIDAKHEAAQEELRETEQEHQALIDDFNQQTQFFREKERKLHAEIARYRRFFSSLEEVKGIEKPVAETII